jgi:glutamine cyclotransferase
VTYAGPPLAQGQQYFARVKAYDSLSWGNWSESPFILSINHPPVADAGHDTMVIAVPTCLTSVVLDGTGSHDPDGDTLSYLWTGPFGTTAGANVAVYLNPDTALIYLIVSDGKGGSGMDSVTIIVRDTIAPVPSTSPLAPLSGECTITITTPPTAIDNCQGLIVGSTDSLVFSTPGTRVITWRFTDGCGNTSTQQQTIIVADNTAPIPDLQTLPQLNGECFVNVTNYPTATDNCQGLIVGSTDSLVFLTPGTRVITWHYTDGSGNTATQQQTIVVADNTSPVPDLQTLPQLNEECIVNVTNYPTATDNCGGLIVGTTPDPLSYSQVGTYTITWHYEDFSGNSITQPQQIIVTDNTAPVPNVTQLPVLQANCVVTVTSYPTATDNCNGVITATTTDPLSYSKAGTYTINWQYNDGNGNTSTQQQTIIVIDNVAPVPSVSQLPVINGVIVGTRCYTVRTYPTAMDNCKGRIVGTTSSPLIYCTRGVFTIVWRYSDGNGNVTTQNQTVNIR